MNLTESISIISLALPSVFLLAASIALYSTKGKVSINYPGSDKWDTDLKHKINYSFLGCGLRTVMVAVIFMAIELIVLSLQVVNFDRLILSAAMVCIVNVFFPLLFFIISVPKIVKSAQQVDAPASASPAR